MLTFTECQIVLFGVGSRSPMTGCPLGGHVNAPWYLVVVCKLLERWSSWVDDRCERVDHPPAGKAGLVLPQSSVTCLSTPLFVRVLGMLQQVVTIVTVTRILSLACQTQDVVV